MLKYFFYLLIIPSLLFGALKESDKQNLKNINLLKNAGFENHLATWVSSGGSFTQETISPLFGKSSAKFNAANSGEYFETPLVTIDEGMKSGTCSAYFWGKYVTGSSGDYQARLLDDSNNVIAGPIDVPVTGIEALKIPIASFKCGAVSSGQYKVRLTSTVDAGDIISDKFFLGLGEEFQVSQSKIYGTAKYLGSTANCDWSTTSGTLGDFAVDSDCTTPVLSGNASVPSTKIPAIKFSKLKKGKIVVQASAAFSAGSSTSGNAICSFGISDGTNVNGFASAYQVANQGVDNISSLQAVFEYASDQTDVTFRIQGKRVEGDGACYVLSSVADARELQFIVTYYPLESETALPLDKTSFLINANITKGTGDTIDLGGVADPMGPVGASDLTMVLNENSSPAQIPCNGVESTGLTCSGVDERLGISFTPRKIGTHEICMNFSHSITSQSSSAASLAVRFKLSYTQNDSNTIITNGYSTVESGHRINSANTPYTVKPIRICEQFNFTDVSKKTVRLFRTNIFDANASGNVVLINDLDSDKAMINITVRNISQAGPQIVFPEINDALAEKINILSTNGEYVVGTAICGQNGTQTCVEESGPWLQSISDSGDGLSDITFESGFFSGIDRPNCFLQGIESTANTMKLCASFNTTTTGTSILCELKGSTTNVDTAFNILCIGQKGSL